jgi:hypothetical protein
MGVLGAALPIGCVGTTKDCDACTAYEATRYATLADWGCWAAQIASGTLDSHIYLVIVQHRTNSLALLVEIKLAGVKSLTHLVRVNPLTHNSHSAQQNFSSNISAQRRQSSFDGSNKLTCTRSIK